MAHCVAGLAKGYTCATQTDRRTLTVFALVAAMAVMPLMAACSSNKKAEQDITITACRADAGGGRPTADGTIVNHSSKASTYVVDVKFYDSANNQVSEGGATVGKVLPAATSIFHAVGLSGAKGPLTCKLGNVARTVAP